MRRERFIAIIAMVRSYLKLVCAYQLREFGCLLLTLIGLETITRLKRVREGTRNKWVCAEVELFVIDTDCSSAVLRSGTFPFYVCFLCEG